MFDLNRDGIQFYAGAVAVPARDQLGRFMGEQPEVSDDEILDGVAQCNCVWDLVVSDHQFDDNVELEDIAGEDPTSNDNEITPFRGTMVCIEYEDEFGVDISFITTEEWVESKYRKQYPHLWNARIDEPPAHRHSGNPNFRSGKSYYYLDNVERHVHQKTVHTDSGTKKLYRSTSDSCGRHGRKKPFWWSALAERRRCNKKENLNYNLSSHSTREVLTANHWLDDMAEFDGEMTFGTKHPAGQLADAYRRLLLVNSIDRELKDMWAQDWAEFENLAQAFWRKQPSFGFYGEDADLRLLHIGYWCGAFARRPEYDYEYGFYNHHAENHKVAHGWLGYEEELALEAEARPYIDDMDFRDDWFMDSMSQDDSLPAGYDEEDERRRQEELDFASMIPTEEEMLALEEARLAKIDREDAEVESRTFAHSGGMLGKKAVIAARQERLRVHDFA